MKKEKKKKEREKRNIPSPLSLNESPKTTMDVNSLENVLAAVPKAKGWVESLAL